MTEQKLDLEKRVDALEARTHTILEGLNSILTEIAKIDVTVEEQKIAPTDPAEYDKLFWEKREGAKGIFERTSKKATNNHSTFQALQKTVKEHKGFCHIGGYRYWFDQNDEDVIDRRKN